MCAYVAFSLFYGDGVWGWKRRIRPSIPSKQRLKSTFGSCCGSRGGGGGRVSFADCVLAFFRFGGRRAGGGVYFIWERTVICWEAHRRVSFIHSMMCWFLQTVQRRSLPCVFVCVRFIFYFFWIYYEISWRCVQGDCCCVVDTYHQAVNAEGFAVILAAHIGGGGYSIKVTS